MQIGESVIYVDSFKREHLALVTNVFNANPANYPDGNVPKPGVNLVYVSTDETKGDTYGRQIERQTSCVHISSNVAGANCWKDLAE